MSTTQFIDELAAGNASVAKDILNDMLSARAFEALEGRKIEIAQNIFNGSQVQEEEVEITQEEFDQLDELSKGTVRSYLKKSKEQESGALGRQGATTNNDMSPIDAGDKAYEGKKRAIAKLGGSKSVLPSKVPAK
jgi:hypothetical protein